MTMTSFDFHTFRTIKKYFQHLYFEKVIHRMIVIQVILFSIIPLVQSSAGRCYLCSEETLVECAGRNQSNSWIDDDILQYYTEPCNGQCVLFRNENQAIIRGCSWTYGHMKRKAVGWHEISPGILAYFCDAYLCNNGSYQSRNRKEVRLNTQQLFLMGGNYPLTSSFGEISPRQLRQCYSCTARFQGCGEFLNPHYASKYIRSCPTSCIIFRNPHDLHLITRDCSFFWPQVHAKSGLHKLFGSDAYFCQESLCNGISFDFIMGILHNQLSAVITFPPNVNLQTTSIVWENTTELVPINNDTTISLIFNETSSSTESFNTTEVLTTLTYSYTENNDTLSSTTPEMNLLSFMPIDFLPNEPDDDYIEPLVMPPFSWMLNMAAENSSQPPPSTTTVIPATSYDYCKNQQCHHGGRLSPDCFCICLPAFTGDSCETVLCDNEPVDSCAFILEHECENPDIRYLCPKFCQFELCPPDIDETFLS